MSIRRQSLNQLSLFLICILSASNLLSQNSYKLIAAKSSLLIYGTSTLHDWSMNAKEFSCSFDAIFKNQTPVKINKINFSTNANSIASENSSMDSKAHAALKADKFPVITFKSDSVNFINESNDKFSGQITGEMIIAGKTKSIRIELKGAIDGEKSITTNGSFHIRMSDFEVEPPTAFLGTLKTGNEITLQYLFEFSK